MASYKNNDIRRETIMSHYSNPKFKVDSLENEDIEMFSRHCVDELHLELGFKSGKLVDPKFSGTGCAIFLSSIDIFLETIKDKTKPEIKEVISNYHNMINQSGKYNLDILGKLGVFENVSEHLNRLHCAEIIELAVDKTIGSKNE